MNKLRKIFLLVLMGAVLSISLVGCGHKNEQPSKDQPSQEQPSQEHPSSEHPSGEHPK